ncbi:signal peptide peptidase SppA [Corallincola spongiicola]|uniref:Signal peptide peptidase SppA n=1 Tax=Corallincola spongiicola TaxID=2520508 RepID=A0ABY1WVH7_9GAMM|nr:signal peptide peptidase SppA [Corallincola spongiicola]TAA48571.1 signal peptide peptidase SppA [Corallincola spongiicola]
MKYLKKFFSFIGKALTTTRSVLTNLLFVVFLLVFLTTLFADKGPSMPEKAALILSIQGNVVEQKVSVDPAEAFTKQLLGGKEKPKETLLKDIIFAIENAQHDQRIKALVIETRDMAPTGLNKLQAIGAAIEAFKASGKPVFSIGDYYAQHQYYLAAHADEVYLNPQGMVMLEGFGRYRTYFKSLLEKLKVTPHVFRVGTFKSAIEPYIRDDMSPAAKEANMAWMNDLWTAYKQDIATQRGLDEEKLNFSIQSLLSNLKAVDGDFAQMALNTGLVDGLKTREELRQPIIEVVGQDPEHKSFNQVWLQEYLAVIRPHQAPHEHKDRVGIVIAKGTILNGDQPAGTIGGDSTARLLRQARLDDAIKAVVLRVDSPGGSAFASELIRNEVEELKRAGKPVVASMSTYAASGGYWISVSADEIWAAPTTITGSIGIFGMITTIDRALDHIGVHTDGVGTTDIAGLGITRPLDPGVSEIIQRTIEHGYHQFIGLVAEEREMTPEQVDKIAQGRVWSGKQAYELGLVDNLGTLQDAVSAAADLAGLSAYDVDEVQRPMSFREHLVNQLLNGSAMIIANEQGQEFSGFQPQSQIMIELKRMFSDLSVLNELNDPMGAYARCLGCEIY